MIQYMPQVPLSVQEVSLDKVYARVDSMIKDMRQSYMISTHPNPELNLIKDKTPVFGLDIIERPV